MQEKSRDKNQLENILKIKKYPSMVLRVKAAIADSFILVLFMYGASDFLSMFDNVPGAIRISIFIFISFLYDPISTSFFGGTIGHNIAGIRVKRENDEKRNISFPIAIIRFLIKVFFGWISLLTMGVNSKKKAIHDIAVKSVVVHAEE